MNAFNGDRLSVSRRHAPCDFCRHYESGSFCRKNLRVVDVIERRFSLDLDNVYDMCSFFEKKKERQLTWTQFVDVLQRLRCRQLEIIF